MSAILDDSIGPASLPMSTTHALRRVALERESAAWTAILETHGVDILQMAQRITGDSALSDDIAQETLLQIRDYAGRFRPPANPGDAEAAARGWIMCIAYRASLGMLRQRKRREQNEARARVELRARLPEMQDAVLLGEQLALLRQEVSELPELLRSAVCLHYYAQLSIPELSATLNCTEAAARKRVERGVQCLRERLMRGGLALGTVALVSSLHTPARAAENSASIQCFEKWQSVLYSPSAPALSFATHLGVIAIMTKHFAAAVAILALLLCGVQTYRLNALSQPSDDKTISALQSRIDSLEGKLAAAQGDAEAFRLSVLARKQEAEPPERAQAAPPAAAGNPNGAATKKFNPVGLWRKEDGAYLRLFADHTLDFIDSKGTWEVLGENLIIEYVKWGRKVAPIVDNDMFEEGGTVFTRVVNTMPAADKNLRPNFGNPNAQNPGQNETVMKYLGGGIIQYQLPDGKIVIVDGSLILQAWKDEKPVAPPMAGRPAGGGGQATPAKPPKSPGDAGF